MANLDSACWKTLLCIVTCDQPFVICFEWVTHSKQTTKGWSHVCDYSVHISGAIGATSGVWQRIEIFA